MQVSIQPKARSLLRALPKTEGMETVEGKKSMGGQLCVSNSIVVVWGVLRGTEGFLGIPRGYSETVDGKFPCWEVLSREFLLSL